jgi:hypothetical protein
MGVFSYNNPQKNRSFTAHLNLFKKMSDKSLTTVAHDVIVQRAFDFCALATSRQTVLAVGNKALTTEWFIQLKEDANAAVLLPTYGQLQAENAQVTALRNTHLKEARPLLQNLFHYAGLAYPLDKDPTRYFRHDLYTQAGSNPGKLLKAAQAAVAALVTRRPAIELAGMPEVQLNRLIELAGLAQGNTTDVHVVQGETSVTIGHQADEFDLLWEKCGLIAAAAVVVYRGDSEQRRLFLLYPDGPEERSLTLAPGTASAPTVRGLLLANTLSADRRLSITIEAEAGPVRVLLLAPDGSFSPSDGTELIATKPNKPHRCKASSLGWVQPSDQQFIVINPTTAKVRLSVRVMPLGE